MISMEPEVRVEAPRPNYRVEDWGNFRKGLASKLRNLEAREELASKGEFYRWLDGLTCAIREVINEKVLKIKPSPFMKRWWSRELADSQREVRRVAWQAYKKKAHLQDPIHQMHRAKRNINGSMIEQVKRAHWEGFLVTLDDKAVWTAHRYMSGEPMDGGKHGCLC